MQIVEMVLGIVFITAVTAVLIVKNLTGNRSSSSENPELSSSLTEIEKRLGVIEKRLENLETITTSKSFQLDREFENLKEKHERA